MKTVHYNKTCFSLFVVLFTTCALLLTISTENNVYQVQVSTTEVVFSPTQEKKPFKDFKHVTKSLDQLGKMDIINSHILFFNRIPHSGSQALMAILENLQGWNNFRIISLGEKRRILAPIEQEELVYDVYNVIRNKPVPLCFEKTIHFVNFSSFDKQSPTFFNIIRNPIDNIVARYNANAFKNNKLQPLELEDCIRKNNPRCVFTEGQAYDLTISYFCGQDIECMHLGSDTALQKAKENVEKYYVTVGIFEEFNTTLEVMENNIGYFFKGAQKINREKLISKNDKIEISPFITSYLKKKLRLEMEFYNWIKGRLFSQLQILYGDHSGH